MITIHHMVLLHLAKHVMYIIIIIQYTFELCCNTQYLCTAHIMLYSIMFEGIYDMIDVKYDFDVTTMLSKLIMHEHHIQPLIVPGLFVTHKHKPSIII